jgi:hypothetical protein
LLINKVTLIHQLQLGSPTYLIWERQTPLYEKRGKVGDSEIKDGSKEDTDNIDK